MKIGVIVDNDLNNDKRVLRELAILRESGNKIFVLCFGFGNDSYNAVEGINISRIRISRKLKDIMFFFFNLIPIYELIWARAIKRFILKNDISILHVHDLYMAKAAFKGIRLSGIHIPMILDLHENYAFAVTTYNWTRGFLRNLLSMPGRWQKKEKEYLMYADRLIVLSEDFRDLLTIRYPCLQAEVFTVLPNVPDLGQMEIKKQVRPGIRIKGNGPVLFYFGVVAERRGIFDALEVFAELVREQQNLSFLIVGPVDKKDKAKFFSIINSDPLKERVYYIAWIDAGELPAYLGISDICLAPFHKNPQHESGVANKIYDYMLGKKPVIASDCRPQKKLIEKYGCGIVYSTHEEMKAAIKTLSADPELRRKMGENGFNAILREHNINVIKERLTRVYKEILSGRS